MTTEAIAQSLRPDFRGLEPSVQDYILRRGYKRLFLAHNNAGEPVILAHTRNLVPYGAVQRDQMPWPLPSRVPFRSYYKVGDFIMARTVDRRELVGQFPILEERYPMDAVGTYLNVLDYLLFGNRPRLRQFRIARKIVEIRPGADGNGLVRTRGVVWHGRRVAFLEPSGSGEFSQQHLAESFQYAEAGAGGDDAVEFLERYCDVLLQIVFAIEGGKNGVFGELQAAFLGTGRRVLSRVAPKVLSLAEREAVQTLGKMAQAFFVGAAEDAVSQLRRSPTHRWQDIDWRNALAKGASKSAEELIGALFEQFQKIFDPYSPVDASIALTQADAAAYIRALSTPLRSQLAGHLAGRLLVAVMRGPIDLAIQSLIEAVPPGTDGRVYEDRVLDIVKEELRSKLNFNSWDSIQSVAESAMDFITENHAVFAGGSE